MILQDEIIHGWWFQIQTLRFVPFNKWNDDPTEQHLRFPMAIDLVQILIVSYLPRFNHVWGWVEASNHQPTRTCSDYIRNVPPQHFHMWSYRCQKIQKSNQHVTDAGHIKVREHQNLAEKKWMLIFIPIAPSWWHDCSGSGLWTFDPKPPHRRQWASCGIYQKKQ
jgi:hypothetical protein